MDRKGQMTLEIVIMLLLVINIYAYISKPLSDVSMAATQSVGVSAMAVKAVDTIANKVNLVGVGGDGAKDEVKLTVFEDFISISYSNKNITIKYTANDLTKATNLTSFGVRPIISDTTFTYSRLVDFQMSGSFGNVNADALKCLSFTNDNGEVHISSC